jgi:hypothetical protein
MLMIYLNRNLQTFQHNLDVKLDKHINCSSYDIVIEVKENFFSFESNLSLVEVTEIKTFNNNKAKKIFMAFPSPSLVTLDFRVFEKKVCSFLEVLYM